jgi:hypothetical protein
MRYASKEALARLKVRERKRGGRRKGLVRKEKRTEQEGGRK